MSGIRSGELFTKTEKLTWREPDAAQLAGSKARGNRCAAQLHAFIATRTGLSLRELG